MTKIAHGGEDMRFLTYGESHGPQVGVVIEGFPAGVPVSAEAINLDLQRRQRGYGRGGRMRLESDRAEILSGVRHGFSLGGPIALSILNKDWPRWQRTMSAEPQTEEAGAEQEIAGDERLAKVGASAHIPRPGHADLAGAMKYGFDDLRNVLERASARETAARVAAGALARQLLKAFGIEVGSYVQRIGGVGADGVALPGADRIKAVEESPARCPDPALEARMLAAIDQARESGDSLGGCFVVYAYGLPAGLGSYVHWDRRLDGRLAQAVMSIPAVKGVEIGSGFAAAERRGSEVHDAIGYDPARGFVRATNNAGGLEGGVTNGEPLWLRAAMKPIPTLYNPLDSVDLRGRKAAKAGVERSDVCAVPAAAVVAEAMTAWVLADALTEKFGGDTLQEMLEAYRAYQERLEKKFGQPPARRGNA